MLRVLPEDFPAAVVVGQHLSGQGSRLAEILGRRVALPVAWARQGEPIASGCVTICPPRSRLEVLPDGTCSLQPAGGALRERPLDALLRSLADSFGAGAAGVVLTGMGSDAAEGARALREAGGLVLVQSEESAMEPAMPRAVVEAGAAGLVLPLHQIGPVLIDAALGRKLPRSPSEVDAIGEVFGEKGQIAALAREVDWTLTPLGPASSWSPVMRATLRLAMESAQPVAVVWGEDRLMLFNDATIPILGAQWVDAFARPHREAFPAVRPARSTHVGAALAGP